MLELAKYQKEALPKAAGAESDVISSTDVVRNLHPDYTGEGTYFDRLQVHLSDRMTKRLRYGVYDFIYRLK